MWIIVPVIMGIAATVFMFALGFVMALGSMAGPTHAGDSIIMLFITIPASLLSAFLTRRAGFGRSIFGGLIFSAPIVLLCYLSAADTVGQNAAEQSRVIYRVAHTTIGFALVASVFFAMFAKVNREKKDENPKPAA